MRVAILDLCELLGLELTTLQRERLAAMGVDELEALRRAIKQTCAWPTPGADPPGAAEPLAAGEGRLPD